MEGLSDFDRGLLVGLLIGEGSFGGDGKQPQVTLRMHVRHEALFTWLMQRFPNSRLYGPYHHGGRSYYQWMARGRTLVHDVLPLLRDELHPELDGHAFARFETMCARYAGYIEREAARPPSKAAGSSAAAAGPPSKAAGLSSEAAGPSSGAAGAADVLPDRRDGPS